MPNANATAYLGRRIIVVRCSISARVLEFSPNQRSIIDVGTYRKSEHGQILSRSVASRVCIGGRLVLGRVHDREPLCVPGCISVPTYIHDLFFKKKKHFLRCCTSIVVANCLGYVYAAWAWSIYSTKVQSGKCNVYSFGEQRASPPIYLVRVYTLEWPRYGSVLFGPTVAYFPARGFCLACCPGS